MSMRYVATVLDTLTELSASETLVLLCLADHAGDDTRACYPRISTLARRSRLSRRATQYALSKLESEGYIEIRPRQSRSSVYRMLFDHAGQRRPASEWATEDETAEKAEQARLVADSVGGATDARLEPQGGATRAPRGATGAPKGATGAPITNNLNLSLNQRTRAPAREPATETGSRSSDEQKRRQREALDAVYATERSQPSEGLSHVQDMLRRARTRSGDDAEAAA